MRGIVVGVDGSEASHRALEWAVEQARLRGDVPVTAVHAYRPPARRESGPSPYPSMRGPYVPANTMVQVVERQRTWLEEAEQMSRSQAESVLSRAIARVETKGGPRVDRYVVERDPASALVDLSAGADLLVVGHRGRGGFKGLRLGSVSHKCAHHSRCPVVVVR